MQEETEETTPETPVIVTPDNFDYGATLKDMDAPYHHNLDELLPGPKSTGATKPVRATTVKLSTPKKGAAPLGHHGSCGESSTGGALHSAAVRYFSLKVNGGGQSIM